MANQTASASPPFFLDSSPLEYLDPGSAYHASILPSILAGSLGVFTWDLLDNILDDYRLIFRSQFTLGTLAYIGSRLGSLAFVLSTIIFQTAPIENCRHFKTIANTFYPISFGCSGLLLLFRVRGIYKRSRIVVGFFFILWSGLVGCTLLMPIGVIGGTVGSSKFCEEAHIPTTDYVAIVAPVVYDTLVFSAIVWRLVQNAYVEDSFKKNIQVAMFGKYLFPFTKALLLDSQRYYLVTLISNSGLLALAFATPIPAPLKRATVVPNLALTSIMACRVYRSTKARLVGINVPSRNNTSIPGPLVFHSSSAYSLESEPTHHGADNNLAASNKFCLTDLQKINGIL